jgi:hypothetical protein
MALLRHPEGLNHEIIEHINNNPLLQGPVHNAYLIQDELV